jgi:putative transposase
LIESFNAKLMEECLNQCWFLSLKDAKEKIEAWRQNHNEWRPHRSLDNLSPSQYLEKQALQEMPVFPTLAGTVLG